MSRVGRKPVKLKAKVKVSVQDGRVRVEGPRGVIERPLPTGVELQVGTEEVRVLAPEADRANRGFQGLTQALLATWVQGVSEGYVKRLEVSGVGYKFEMKAKALGVAVGFSHPVELAIPDELTLALDKAQVKLTVAGWDKQMVGQFAASVRAVKPCEPYKGKGIKYDTEVVRRKAGKASGKK